MKNIKNIVIGLALGLTFLFAAPTTQAQTGTVTVNVGTNLVQIVQATNGWLITSVNIQGGSGAATVSIYDHNTNYLTYTNAAYWSRGYYTTNISAIFTNNQGIVQTNIYPGIYTYSNYVASASNNVPAQWVGTVGANGGVTYSTAIVTTKGVVITGSTNAVVTLTYTTPY